MSNTIKPLDNAKFGKVGESLGRTQGASSTEGSKSADVARSGAAQPGSDTVELTSGAKLLERLDKSLASLPEIDPARVEAVKTAIGNGDYTIDADKIANALIRLDKEFGG